MRLTFSKVLKNLKLQCTSGATAVEYGIISSLIAGAVLASVWESGQELSNGFNTIAETLGDDIIDENRESMFDDFYNFTAETGCNGFGSCGHQGNQGVWEGFKEFASSNTIFDDLLIDRVTFESGIFQDARNRTYQEMGISSWGSATQVAAEEASQQIWLELASEYTSSQ